MLINILSLTMFTFAKQQQSVREHFLLNKQNNFLTVEDTITVPITVEKKVTEIITITNSKLKPVMTNFTEYKFKRAFDKLIAVRDDVVFSTITSSYDTCNTSFATSYITFTVPQTVFTTQDVSVTSGVDTTLTNVVSPVTTSTVDTTIPITVINTSTNTVNVYTCITSVSNTNIDEITANLLAYQVTELSSLNSFQTDTFYPSVTNYANNIAFNGSALISSQTIDVLFSTLRLQMSAYQQIQITAAENGQSQAYQYSALLDFQSFQLSILNAFQQDQLASSDYLNLSPQDQSYFLNNIILLEYNLFASNFIGFYQLLQRNNFQAFQQSQANLYPTRAFDLRNELSRFNKFA